MSGAHKPIIKFERKGMCPAGKTKRGQEKGGGPQPSVKGERLSLLSEEGGGVCPY